MAAFSGPKIHNENLELLMDPSNTKAVPGYPDRREHGTSEWFSFSNASATYARPYPGTTIYSIDTNGNIAEVLSANSEPDRGTFSTSAGYRYYGDKAIHLMHMGEQQRLIPSSLYGTQFGNISNRYGSSTYYFHAPFEDATVSVYDNVSGGINGTATTTISVSRAGSNTYSTTTENAYVIFESDVPIIMSVAEDSGDRLIMPPAATRIYRRRNHYERTITNEGPSTNNTHYVSSTTPCFTVEIADGAGGDACQGLAYENLSEAFAFGNNLSDYHIVAPFPDTVVDVLYYSNNKWNRLEQHSMNGSETNPVVVARDGNGGGYDDSGRSTYFANNANLWYFVSNNPVLITINDTGDDEDILLGWTISNKEKTYLSSVPSFRNIVKRKFKLSKVKVDNKSFIYETKQNYIQLDGVDQKITIPNLSGAYNIGTSDFTISAWIYPQSFSNYTHIFTFDDQSMFSLKAASSTGKIYFFGGSSYRTNTDELGTWTLSLNQWQHVGFVREGNEHRAYYNGEYIGAKTITAKNISCDNVHIGWGWATEYTQQRRGVTKFYKKALTTNEMKNNFEAHRNRYGV